MDWSDTNDENVVGFIESTELSNRNMLVFDYLNY